jgi:ATP-independent RNA helicase DbpA
MNERCSFEDAPVIAGSQSGTVARTSRKTHDCRQNQVFAVVSSERQAWLECSLRRQGRTSGAMLGWRTEGFATTDACIVASEDSAVAFSSLPLSPALLEAVERLGFRELTPIQSLTIPPLLEGRDLVGQSQTGSGKTAAFALPLLQRLDLSTRELQAMVLCPTRELSAQVAREVRKLGHGLPGLAVAVLSGGEPVRDQARTLEPGVHLVVGTPGRVLDHLRRRTLRVHRTRTVVLDEADRMLDMGFLPDIEQVLKALPSPRQSVFFSATFPESIHELSQKHQTDPVWARVEPEASRAPDIRELVIQSQPANKFATLRSVLEQHAHESALVFANLKVTVAELERALASAGMSVESLHGDLEQRDRDRVLAKFRNGSTRLLIATDVAARGIDLDSLDLVVNFDLPDRPEIYVHRIGRTGRAGKSGLAVSLVTPLDAERCAAIEAFIERPLLLKTAVPAPSTVERSARPPRDAKMATLRLFGGRKDKLRPGDILGALTGEAGGLLGTQVGKIEIHDRFAYVAVEKSVSEQALKSLREGRIKGRRFRVTRED